MNTTDMIVGALEGVVWSIGAVGVLLMVSIFGPPVENAYFPVLTDFKIEKTETLSDYTLYDVSFVKVRDCDVDPGSFSWYVTDEFGRQEKVLVEFPKTTGNQSRPIGLNVTKGIKVHNAGRDIIAQKIIVNHSCHVGWKTKSEVRVN